ncbi:ATP-binding protein [Brevundimonas naejangsanensis]|uniref:ATP-binding protein n=1 Tax=Brevundimonas naejangsanensis TaxID=588932 RepID=UPI0026F2B71E|nr:ATP-binding protein [Brevundimonas naejangsanensis]
MTIELDEPELEFDHNVVEHLGIKLYQNKIPNVLAEVVANSWDADATHVWVTTSKSTGSSEGFIAVADDGSGMDYDAIKNRYLVIGKPKRKNPKDRSLGGRGPMGRKGIGKLAPFGIAREVQVVTLSKQRISWFSLELSGLLSAGPGHTKYRPPFKLRDIPLSDMELPPEADTNGGLIRQFVDSCIEGNGSGTLVVMTKLSSNREIVSDELVAGLVDRFTVALARPDFVVSVDGKIIDPKDALPAFELRIPHADQPYATELVEGREVRFWAGFVQSPAWSSDQAGVGVFVHGKIGQDRPFYFGAKGKEIFQRYLYAVVEADWLDELDHDLISTDRTSINWDDPAAASLREWGRKKVGSWVDAYRDHRAGLHMLEVKAAASARRASGKSLTFSPAENERLDELVAEATRELGKGEAAEAARDELLTAISQAWVNLPSRKLITGLWDALKPDGSAVPFTEIAKKLHEHSVPEAMGLALTFAQRAYALTVLTELVHRRSETDIQLLIEEFPWILQPRGEQLSADQWLKTTIDKAALALGDDEADRAGRIIQGISDRERADFVFLTDPQRKKIQIVELKGPRVELTQAHRRQLVDYLDFVEMHYSSAQVTGLLIGRMPDPPINPKDERITARSWDDLLGDCRAAYIDLLASMLEHADVDPGDTRVELIKQFGGAPVWELLGRLAQADSRLGSLMTRFNPMLDEQAAVGQESPDT